MSKSTSYGILPDRKAAVGHTGKKFSIYIHKRMYSIKMTFVKTTIATGAATHAQANQG